MDCAETFIEEVSMHTRKRKKRHKGKSQVSKKMRRLVERAFALDRRQHESITIDGTNKNATELWQAMYEADREEEHRKRMAGEAKRDLLAAIAELELNLSQRLYGRNIGIYIPPSKIRIDSPLLPNVYE
jgi:hypothetical protein